MTQYDLDTLLSPHDRAQTKEFYLKVMNSVLSLLPARGEGVRREAAVDAAHNAIEDMAVHLSLRRLKIQLERAVAENDVEASKACREMLQQYRNRIKDRGIRKWNGRTDPFTWTRTNARGRLTNYFRDHARRCAIARDGRDEIITNLHPGEFHTQDPIDALIEQTESSNTKAERYRILVEKLERGFSNSGGAQNLLLRAVVEYIFRTQDVTAQDIMGHFAMDAKLARKLLRDLRALLRSRPKVSVRNKRSARNKYAPNCTPPPTTTSEMSRDSISEMQPQRPAILRSDLLVSQMTRGVL